LYKLGVRTIHLYIIKYLHLTTMNDRYSHLADILEEHLWQRAKADIDTLLTFPEFAYCGVGFRVLFLEEGKAVQSLKGQSFSKSKLAIETILMKADSAFLSWKKPYSFTCNIQGFDVQQALLHLKKLELIQERTFSGFSARAETAKRPA